MMHVLYRSVMGRVEMTDQKTAIPEQDITDFLPIRWAFTCWVSGGESPWDFTEWRSMLLGWDDRGWKRFFLVFKDIRSRRIVMSFLRDKDATSLMGFLLLYEKARSNYEYLLRENGII